MEQEPVQDSQASESVLAKTPQSIPMKEEMTEVQKINEQIIF